MIDLARKILGQRGSGERPAQPGRSEDSSEPDLRVATCALFLEMAIVDREFSETERDEILSILRNEYGLSDDDADELIRASNEELERSIDRWKFTHLINQNYSDEQKIRVVELLWKIVYADGTLDAHEHYLVRKISRLLRLKHRQLIEAKLRVTEAENS